MNLKTITFDADKWQLMPKVATDKMNAAAAYTETFAEAYAELIAAAPQPEPLSPLLPIGEFEQSPTLGACWVQIKDIGVILARCDKFLNSFAIYALGSSGHMLDGVTHVMPITKPQPPEAE